MLQRAGAERRPLSLLLRPNGSTALTDGEATLFESANQTAACHAALAVGPPKFKGRKCPYQLPREMREMRRVQAKSQLIAAALSGRLSVNY